MATGYTAPHRPAGRPSSGLRTAIGLGALAEVVVYVLVANWIGLGWTLLATLATWLATNGNSTETGGLLFCHRNTVRNRLARLEQLSGQSLEDPRSVARLFVAVEALRLLDPAVLGDAGSS